MTPLRIATLAALGVCCIGVVWRLAMWFVRPVGPDARTTTLRARLLSLPGLLWPGSIGGLLRALFWDTLLQGRLFHANRVRWLGHLLIVTGCLVLVLMHGLGSVLAVKLFKGYQSTLDPFLLVRDVAGLLVVVGVLLVFGQRAVQRAGRPSPRRPWDGAFVALLVLAVLTGFLLKGIKIASPRAFYRMADKYIGTTDPEELSGLRAVWAQDFGVYFDDAPVSDDPEVIAEGRDLHKDACADCHSRPTSALVSWPVSRAVAPVVGHLDPAGGLLYWVHVAACLLGLATLPATRFIHVLADPVALLATRKRGAASVVKRAIALDACLRCSLCDTRCSVAPLARALANPFLLPSHKLAEVARQGPMPMVVEGAFLCTSCGRCTEVCPTGLDLNDLWTARRADLEAAGEVAPARFVKGRSAARWAEALANTQVEAGPLTGNPRTFAQCAQCQTCTNVCPVVAASTDPANGADITPQKVMNLLRLGLHRFALGSRMVWDCATCYQCQEHCPEGIKVTEVMLELREMAYRGFARERRLG